MFVKWQMSWIIHCSRVFNNNNPSVYQQESEYTKVEPYSGIDYTAVKTKNGNIL